MKSNIVDTISNKSNILEKIDSLEIQNQIDKLKYQIDTQNNIVNQVNDFYDSAWLKLLIVITVLGIILPIIVEYFQRKNYKELAINLKKSYDDKLESFEENNKLKIDKIIKEYEDIFKKLELKYDKSMHEMDANTYYLQGRTLFNEGDFKGSVLSYLRSAKLLKKCDRIDRILPVINNMSGALKLCDEEKIIQLDDSVAKVFENKDFVNII